jgi:hypothetical protein
VELNAVSLADAVFSYSHLVWMLVRCAVDAPLT